MFCLMLIDEGYSLIVALAITIPIAGILGVFTSLMYYFL
jgi:hypothetical protein